MTALVLSDSHGDVEAMARAVEKTHPDLIVHLGDCWRDAEELRMLFPRLPMEQVPGNCDRHRCYPPQPEILCFEIGGVRLYMTHGHLHAVKMTTGRLLRAASEAKAEAVLYGHTHQPDCRQEEGMWILNPGTCGSWGGSVGLIRIENGQIVSCSILSQKDLEEFK